jgi:hypothetical protein
VLIVFISVLNEKNKKIEKELREDGYYDWDSCRQYPNL